MSYFDLTKDSQILARSGNPDQQYQQIIRDVKLNQEINPKFLIRTHNLFSIIRLILIYARVLKLILNYLRIKIYLLRSCNEYSLILASINPPNYENSNIKLEENLQNTNRSQLSNYSHRKFDGNNSEVKKHLKRSQISQINTFAAGKLASSNLAPNTNILFNNFNSNSYNKNHIFPKTTFNHDMNKIGVNQTRFQQTSPPLMNLNLGLTSNPNHRVAKTDRIFSGTKTDFNINVISKTRPSYNNLNMVII